MSFDVLCVNCHLSTAQNCSGLSHKQRHLRVWGKSGACLGKIAKWRHWVFRCCEGDHPKKWLKILGPPNDWMSGRRSLSLSLYYIYIYISTYAPKQCSKPMVSKLAHLATWEPFYYQKIWSLLQWREMKTLILVLDQPFKLPKTYEVYLL